MTVIDILINYNYRIKDWKNSGDRPTHLTRKRNFVRSRGLTLIGSLAGCQDSAEADTTGQAFAKKG